MDTRADLCPLHGVERLIGSSAWVRTIRHEIVRVAAHDSNVLITGPSGTGKELIARAIHAHSARSAGPIVPVDCAALSGELFLSHMFGHLKGAFTGAHYAALGAFRAADCGTIFLDEIGELDPLLQAKLLRVVQEKSVVPLGSHQGQAVDVRIIAATNRHLEEEVRAGRFREDLYYRLNIVSLETAPLKDRPEDIKTLAYHFLCKLTIDGGLPRKRLSPDALSLLLSYHWPGNVRELFNQLERAVVFTEGELLNAESMPQLLRAVRSGQPAVTPCRRYDAVPASQPQENFAPPVRTTSHQLQTGDDGWLSLAEVERNHILLTLEHTFYNQTAAAQLLGMERHALLRKIKKYGLDVSRSQRGRPSAKSLAFPSDSPRPVRTKFAA